MTFGVVPFLSLITILSWWTIVNGLPVVDKGVFVIVGVRSCGNGTGYCILGNDCTVDKEFISDLNGNCSGLGTAFTPSAHFSCCQLITNEPAPITSSTTTTTTPKPGIDSIEETSNSESNSIEESDINSSESTSTSTTATTPAQRPTEYYEEKTEINLEQEISLQEVGCGKNYGSVNTARVASDHLSSSCWVGALVRSPSSSYSLQDPGSFLCTGAMITRDTLLTSATCVSRLLAQELSLFRAVLGSKHLLHPSHGISDANYRTIEEIRVHSGFGGIGGGSSSLHNNIGNQRIRLHDIALVRLGNNPESSTTTGSNSYCSICLPDKNQELTETTECSVTGYSHPPDSNDADGFLHEAPQTIESSIHCNSTNLICASGEKSAEACFSPRDAGSPLSCTIDGTPKLAGVFSSGFHCGNHLSPVYYTDIRQYTDWIRDYAA